MEIYQTAKRPCWRPSKECHDATTGSTTQLNCTRFHNFSYAFQYSLQGAERWIRWQSFFGSNCLWPASTNLEAVWASSSCCSNLPKHAELSTSALADAYPSRIPCLGALFPLRVIEVFIWHHTPWYYRCHVSQVIVLRVLGSLTPQQRRKDDRRVRGWNGLECEELWRCKKKHLGFVEESASLCGGSLIVKFLFALDRGILHRSISCFILSSPTLQDFVFTKDRTKGWVEHGRTVERSIHFNTPSCIGFKL